jgi:hypothetical protein
MSIEIQSWPYVEVKTNYTVRLVRYRVIYRGAASDLQISITATYEFLPPVGLVNSEGLNLFIGNDL